jgi:4-hydroxybenzoyl-CoA thioesterase
MTPDTKLALTVERTVAFGDCDPAGIVYTPRVLDYCLEAIDDWWRKVLDGRGWYELTADHNRGTPFVNVNINFLSPITPRDVLVVTVGLARLGRSSITFDVAGMQAGRVCFQGSTTSVIVDKDAMAKVDADDWVIEAVRAKI